jgi:hypothetical protein
MERQTYIYDLPIRLALKIYALCVTITFQGNIISFSLYWKQEMDRVWDEAQTKDSSILTVILLF